MRRRGGQPGQLTSVPQAVQLPEGEVVVLAWIGHASRAVRDRANASVMADPRRAGMEASLPFDGRRRFRGGFQLLLAS